MNNKSNQFIYYIYFYHIYLNIFFSFYFVLAGTKTMVTAGLRLIRIVALKDPA